MGEETSVLRWGGLAGMLGAAVFVLVIVVLIGLVPPPPSDPAELVRRFPSTRAAVLVGETLHLVAVILWALLFLALYRALRGTGPAPALFGSGLGLLGIASLAVGALPNVAFAEISDLYHAPGATPADQATLVLIWRSIQGIFNETDTVGITLMAIGFIVLGVAMLRAPAFGRGFGAVSVAFGVAVIAGVSAFAVDSLLIFPFVVLAFIVFPLLFGWKVYRLSNTA